MQPGPFALTMARDRSKLCPCPSTASTTCTKAPPPSRAWSPVVVQQHQRGMDSPHKTHIQKPHIHPPHPSPYTSNTSTFLCIPLLTDANAEAVSAMLLAANSTDQSPNKAVWEAWQAYAASPSCHIVGSMLFQTRILSNSNMAEDVLTDALLIATVAAPYCIMYAQPTLMAAAQHCGLLPQRIPSAQRVEYVLGAGLVVQDRHSGGTSTHSCNRRNPPSSSSSTTSDEEDNTPSSSASSDAGRDLLDVPAPTVPLSTLLAAVRHVGQQPELLQQLGNPMRVEVLESLLVQLGLQQFQDRVVMATNVNEAALAWATQRVMELLQEDPDEAQGSVRRLRGQSDHAEACSWSSFASRLPRWPPQDDDGGRSSIVVPHRVVQGERSGVCVYTGVGGAEDIMCNRIRV